MNDFAGRGFRSLGVARADEEGNWQFAGVLPMFYPPREQAKATIASAGQMSVKVKMVTGDQLAIARETAKQLGMGINILDASSLQDKKQQDNGQSSEAIEKADGYAQVFPEDKFHIIQVLQKRGHFVGMTGDGVNDAPALKQADCGIAVSGATDAARAAASIVLLAPGLSVIIDAIKEARRIVQRMNSYAIYRIAETLRVLLFMVLAILVFNFYPVTAVMIVLIAVLNDGAILSIAYDNVHYKKEPEAWNMRLVLGIATVLGIVGPIAAFGLFYIGDRVLHLSHPELQTMMYLLLSVAGHLTIFLTRTRGPFWSIRPAKILWIAVLGTQTVATLIAVYGLFMTPLGWKLAGFVWAYALAWFLLTDRVKLVGYHFLDHAKADAPKSDTRTEAAKPQARTEQLKPEAKTEPKHDEKADVPMPETKPDKPTPELKVEAKPDARVESKLDADPVQPKSDTKAGEPTPEVKAGPNPETKADTPKSEVQGDAPKPDAKDKSRSDVTPQLVKRVHELYEELGREEVRAVQEWEKSEPEIQNK
ncbi:MAG: HAD-IC family P-type ATPase [Acidobacteriaceae bacterium]